MMNMHKTYGASLICRNEEKNIGPCIESIFKQTIKPEIVVIVDDASTDNTYEIIEKYAYKHLEIKPRQVYNIRYNRIKGYNISNAISRSISDLLTLSQPPYILRMDADVVLNNPRYVETLLEIMDDDPEIGITGGVSDKGKYMFRHITDAARIYRLECLKDLLRTSPHEGYPIMYGHDSFMIFRAKWLGWKVKPVNIKFYDARPYQRSVGRWFLTGRFRYMNGFTLIHQFFACIRYLRYKPYIIGSIIAFLTYLLYHALPYKIYEKSYYNFMKRDLNEIVIIGLKNFSKRGNLRRLIY
jgi:glycosyltransferase involved in cell wall biosynthesis